jgi:biotin carboxylase
LPYDKDDPSYLVILGAGPQQVLAYEKAKAMGIKTVALDANPHALAFKSADKSLVANIKNTEECIQALELSGLSFSGVMTYGVDISPVVSAIAAHFDLISVSENVAYNTTHKGARSTQLAEHKIPIPQFCILENLINEPPFEFPFVIKPSDNSGSRGVQQVRDDKEWQQAFEEAKTYSSDGQVIAEEMLFGDEISIEGFVVDGELIIYGFTDRNYLKSVEYDPFFMEDGSSGPSLLPAEITLEAEDVFRKAIKALGINWGPTKGDLISTKEGVYVLEITSRLSPGFSIFLPQVVGVDPLSETIKWVVGWKIDKNDLVPKFSKGVAHRYYFHKPGKIVSIKGIDQLGHLPGVINVMKLQEFDVGHKLTKPTYINRLFYIIVVGETRELAEQLAKNALESVRIELAE